MASLPGTLRNSESAMIAPVSSMRLLVVVTAARADDVVVVMVDDDGAGLAEELRPAVLERGVRADERTDGSGLGLAIVRDLAELYGGSIALADSPVGGLRAVLRLPGG